MGDVKRHFPEGEAPAIVKIGTYLSYLLALLLLATAIYSAATLTVEYHLSLLSLLFLNTCIVGEIIAVFALLLRNKLLAGVSLPLLLWFGGGGLFNFSGSLLSAMHLTHMLMVVVSIYIVFFTWKILGGNKKTFAIGLVLGALAVVILLFAMGWYYSANPSLYNILKDAGWKGPEFR